MISNWSANRCMATHSVNRSRLIRDWPLVIPTSADRTIRVMCCGKGNLLTPEP